MLRLNDLIKKNKTKNLTIVIIQARSSSKRFPSKIFKKFYGKPYILNIYKNFKTMYELTIIATTNKKTDNKLIDLFKQNHISYYRGSEKNLVQRFYNCSSLIKKKLKIKDFKIIRVCADMPFINPSMSKKSLNLLSNNTDYVGYSKKLLDGYNLETFWYSSLKKLSRLKLSDQEKEHLSPGFINHNFKIKELSKISNRLKKNISLSLDYKNDYKNLKKLEKVILKKLGNKIYIPYHSMIKIIKEHKLINSFRLL